MAKQITIELPKGKDWLDYSTLSMLQRCPRSYYWRMIQGVTAAIEPAALLNGTAYHEAKAVYLDHIIAGDTHEVAKHEALLAHIPIMQKIKQDDPKRNVTVSTNTLNNYFEHWKDSHYTPIETEVGFAVDMQHFFFIGRSDSYEKSPFGNVVMETKTTSIVGNRWQFRGDPNLQMDGYFAARYITTGELPWGVCLDVIPVHDKKLIAPFRIIAPRNLEYIERWMDEVQAWYFTLKSYKDNGIFPRNTENCMPLVGFSCNYNDLCKKYPAPHKMKDIELPGDFKVEHWCPIDYEVKEVEADAKKKD